MLRWQRDPYSQNLFLPVESSPSCSHQLPVKTWLSVGKCLFIGLNHTTIWSYCNSNYKPQLRSSPCFMHLEWVMAWRMEKSHFKKRKVRFLLPFHRWEAWRTVSCVLMSQGLCDRAEIGLHVPFKASMLWSSPLPGLFLLGAAGVLNTTPA